MRPFTGLITMITIFLNLSQLKKFQYSFNCMLDSSKSYFDELSFELILNKKKKKTKENFRKILYL